MYAIRRVTGAGGIAAGVLGVLEVALYFVYSGAPPESNVLTRNLLNILLALAFIVFLVGLRRVVRGLDELGDWLAGLMLATGLCYVTVALVASSLEVGDVLAAGGKAIDPTTDGPLAMANVLLHGSIARALTALFLIVAGVAIRRSRALPSWTGTAAIVVGALNAVFVPSLYFGTEAARFYSAVGWGNTALTGSLVAYWACAVGVILVNHETHAGTAARAGRA